MKSLMLFLTLLLAFPAWSATSPDEILDDPQLEERARNLGKELRCLVCQNQSIDDSDAPLARDLRLIVRERLVAGDSDQDVLDYLVARYGDFVLLRPPFKIGTIALWAGPFVILVLGGILALRFMRNRKAVFDEIPTENHDTERAASILAPMERDLAQKN